MYAFHLAPSVRLLRLIALGWLVTLLLAGCGGRDISPSGRILFWHDWNSEESQVLDAVLTKFGEINPDIVVKTQTFANADDMLDEFIAAADSGLGPDLLIARNSWIPALVEAQLIKPTGGLVTPAEQADYMPAALNALTEDGQLYGIPESVDTSVLFYNKRLTDRAPTTLDELLNEANAGRIVAMNSDFVGAFWGVQAFGGGLFAEDQRVVLDEGGFANWLEWLRTARELPGVLLDANQELLQSQFLDGEIAYLVADSSVIGDMVAALGDDLGVAPLPAGPVGSAGPFLRTQGFVFSAVSAPGQTENAILLAKFLTNAEQSATFAREILHAPANLDVRINPRLNPMVSALMSQARTALPVPNVENIDEIVRIAGEAQIKVLEGVVPSAQAVAEVTMALNQLLGIAPQELTQSSCQLVGELRISVLWDEASAAFQQLTAAFRRVCPAIIVEQQAMTLDELRTLAQSTPDAFDRIDLILGEQDALIALLQDDLLLDITSLVNTDNLQRYWPAAISAARAQSGLYGIPMSIDLTALYYNRALVEQPAATLADLERQAVDGVPIVLEATFVNGFWGIAAFGTRTQSNNFGGALDRDGLVDWLDWLRAGATSGHIQLVFDHAEARSRFMRGESGYFVGSPAELAELQMELGADLLGVELLPAGPGGDASPLLTAAAFMVPFNLDESSIDLATAYLTFLTSPDVQGELAVALSRVPVNASTELEEGSPLAVFTDQVRAATVLPNLPDVTAVVAAGDDLFRTALTEPIDISQAVTDTVDSMLTLLVLDATGSLTPTVSPFESTTGPTVTTTVTAAVTASETVTPGD